MFLSRCSTLGSRRYSCLCCCTHCFSLMSSHLRCSPYHIEQNKTEHHQHNSCKYELAFIIFFLVHSSDLYRMGQALADKCRHTFNGSFVQLCQFTMVASAFSVLVDSPQQIGRSVVSMPSDRIRSDFLYIVWFINLQQIWDFQCILFLSSSFLWCSCS